MLSSKFANIILERKIYFTEIYKNFGCDQYYHFRIKNFYDQGGKEHSLLHDFSLKTNLFPKPLFPGFKLSFEANFLVKYTMDIPLDSFPISYFLKNLSEIEHCKGYFYEPSNWQLLERYPWEKAEMAHHYH